MAPESVTDKNTFPKMMEDLRNVFNSGRTLPVTYRLQQLSRFYSMIDENFEDMLEAVNKDMKKARMEGASFELEILKNDAKGTMRELKKWEQREKMPVNLLLPFDSACIKHDPFGVVLIIGAWNYPFLLSLQPLIGAIAAGNVVIVKPSENSGHAAMKMADLIPKYLDPECYKVVLGAVDETKELLNQKFDYIFATSSTCIGKSIMQAAAKHLTPVTLELGGKSPVYIDDDADMEKATKRVLWGKCINLAQTCIAPDYVLCSKKVEQEFIRHAKKVLKDWYGENPQNSPDLPRIINARHFKRLVKLLDETQGNIVLGGDRDSDDLFISPTIVVDVNPDSDILMEDEIFGPILPFVTINSKEEALNFIRNRPKPLALYAFSRSQEILDYFIDNSTSGAVCCNDTVIQNGWEGLPFGGVGDAGIGRYHGKYTYDTFTHHKSVVVRSFSKVEEAMNEFRYPPYSQKKMSSVAMVMRHFHKFNFQKGKALSFLFTCALGIAAMVSVATKWVYPRRKLA